ncbi:hypothetical protein ACOBV8_18505 (plasmid) [Pseudoalteromonas espejiana]
MAKPHTLSHFLFCPNEPVAAAHPSLDLVRKLAVHCKAHYPHAPTQFISRHLYLQFCWQAIYAIVIGIRANTTRANPIHLQLKMSGAYSRGFTLAGAPLLSKAEQIMHLLNL